MTVRETVNAAKERIGEADLAELFEGSRRVTAAKGKKVVVLDLAKDPDAHEQLASVVLGPTGNLRAPSARVGKNWLIGFNEDEYAKVFG